MIRSDVIAVFEEGISMMKDQPTPHSQIAFQVRRRMDIILKKIQAEPTDAVFDTKDQLLRPIHPCYA